MPLDLDLVHEMREIEFEFGETEILSQEDLDHYKEMGPSCVPQMMVEMKESHHKLAKLLAMGLKGGELYSRTTYRPGTISVLRRNPAFAELVETYRGIGDLEFQSFRDACLEAARDGVEQLHTMLRTPDEDISPEFIRKATRDLAELGGISTKHEHVHAHLDGTEIKRIREEMAEKAQESVGAGVGGTREERAVSGERLDGSPSSGNGVPAKIIPILEASVSGGEDSERNLDKVRG